MAIRPDRDGSKPRIALFTRRRLFAAALAWLLLTAVGAAPRAQFQGKDDVGRLLRQSAISSPGQKSRSRTEVLLASPQYLEADRAYRGGHPDSPSEEVAFGTTASTEFFSQLQQSVTSLPGGVSAVVWVEGDYPETDVRMQWVGSGGEKLLEPEGRIVAGLAGFNEDSAAVAPHADAGSFVAFARGSSSSNQAIYVQSFDATGSPRWPGDGVLASTASDSQLDPHLVADSDGGVFVCFERSQIEGIWCQYLSDQGNRLWGSVGLLAGGEAGWRVVPRGVADHSGGLLIFWRNQRDVYDGNVEPMLMEGQHFAGDGTRLWTDDGLLVRTTNLEESNGHSFSFHQVVPDGSGGAILVFNDWVEMSASNLDVVAQRVAGDGSLLWSDGTVVAATAVHHQHENTIASPGGGAFVVAFEEVSSTQSKLRLYRIGGDGSHEWPTTGQELSDPSANALNYGAFGSFDQGILRLVWTHQLLPGTLEMDIRLARYTANGERLDGASGSPVTTAHDAQFVRGMTYSPEARISLAVWDDRRKGTWGDLDVYGGVIMSPFVFLDGFESGDTSAWSRPVP